MSGSFTRGVPTTNNGIKFAGEEAKDKLYEPKHKKRIVRVLTVVAYVFFVSLAAIMLSLYYVFLWSPQKVSNYRLIPVGNTDCSSDKLLLMPVIQRKSQIGSKGMDNAYKTKLQENSEEKERVVAVKVMPKILNGASDISVGLTLANTTDNYTNNANVPSTTVVK